MVDPLVDGFLREYIVDSEITFLSFHHFLCTDLNLQSEVLMSFFTADDNWEKQLELTLLDMGECDCDIPTLPMENARLCDVLTKPGDHLIFCFDIFLNRALYLQLLEIQQANSPTQSCTCINAQGKPPAPSPSMEDSVLADFNELFR